MKKSRIQSCFEYEELLRTIIADLKKIDKLLPAEIARYGCLMKDREAMAIIEGRKHDLMCYIQTICRDHILWAEKLLDKNRVPKGGI